MAVIDDVALIPYSDTQQLVYWTGTAGAVATVEKNGRAIAENAAYTSTARALLVNMGSDEIAEITVHEATDEDIEIIGENLQATQRPRIVWTPPLDSTPIAYKIYHQVSGGTESAIDSVPHDDSKTFYDYTVKQDLTGNAWHFFCVKSIDATGTESTQDQFAFYIEGLPEAVSSLSLVEGSKLADDSGNILVDESGNELIEGWVVTLAY